MNRKEFFKKLGISIGVAIVAPEVIAETPAKEEVWHSRTFTDVTQRGYVCGVDPYTPETVLKVWKQTGNLISEYPRYLLNDVVYVNNERFLIVSVGTEGNYYSEYTLRPFKPKKDIVVSDKWLHLKRAVGEGNILRKYND